ncbi:MAG: VWA domain-containing protein [Pseudomonadota bacterium]
MAEPPRLGADNPRSTTGDLPKANIAIGAADGGVIAENIVHFGRVLRASGLRVGPDRTRLAIEAVLTVGLEDPRRLYWALHAAFVQKRADREIFNQAFVMFWKDPGYLEQMLSLVVPSMRASVEAEDKALSRRLSESLFRPRTPEAPKQEDIVEIDAQGTFSATDAFNQKDFEEMSADELVRARRTISGLILPFDRLRTRRFAPSGNGRLDLRQMIREAGARGPDALRPKWRQPRYKRPPLVILADISGSMDTYARILLHFIHALTNDRDRVSVFLFAVRLTNITKLLRGRDPDVAISEVGREVTDWSGGTRIGTALEEFNRTWARRVLGQNATVLLITDGLDREGGEGIADAARRLSANARRIIWLNPLQRFDGYEPIAAGAAALDQHVDEHRPCHNLASLAALGQALGRR